LRKLRSESFIPFLAVMGIISVVNIETALKLRRRNFRL
jgi:hypothetical protein